jgi:hypothetical protein
MTLARTSTQILRSDGGSATVAVNSPLTGNGSTQLPLGLSEDYRGADGESLTFDIADITDGHRVTISGSQGSSSFDVLNGQAGANGVNGVNGADGQSVAFDITNIVGGHRVTLSGEQGISSFDVMNGDDGVDGVSPTFRFAENEDGITIIVSGAQGEDSFTLYNNEGGHTYSAGPNIDITNSTISGKDWTADIESAISSVSGNYYPMTGNPSGFLTAHQDISNLMPIGESANFYPMTGNPSGFLTAIDLSNYYTKNETSSREEINAAIAAIPGAVDYSAGANIDITNHLISGKDWTDTITAASAYAASQAQGTEYTAGANIDITNHVVSGKDWSNEITAASAYAASQAQGKTYTGVSPIVVNNDEDKVSANCIELSAGNGIDSTKLATGVIEVSGGLGGGVAISGQYVIGESTITADCSAFCMYEQANSTGSYQLMATANNASWHGYGYTMSKPENLLIDDVNSIAQNYAESAVSSHVRLMNYPDITFSAVRDTFNAGGIVVPYETTQGYGTFYNFVSSAVSASTSSYKFDYIGTNGYATVLTVSSENNGAITGKVKNQSRIFLPPSACECKVVVVATSGDIPATGATDGKLYVVTGSGS